MDSTLIVDYPWSNLFTTILIYSWLKIEICEFSNYFDTHSCVFNDHTKMYRHCWIFIKVSKFHHMIACIQSVVKCSSFDLCRAPMMLRGVPWSPSTMLNPGCYNSHDELPRFIRRGKFNYRLVRDDHLPPPFKWKWRVAFKSWDRMLLIEPHHLHIKCLIPH